jgi:hypothetical protein
MKMFRNFQVEWQTRSANAALIEMFNRNMCQDVDILLVFWFFKAESMTAVTLKSVAALDELLNNNQWILTLEAILVTWLRVLAYLWLCRRKIFQ